MPENAPLTVSALTPPDGIVADGIYQLPEMTPGTIEFEIRGTFNSGTVTPGYLDAIGGFVSNGVVVTTPGRILFEMSSCRPNEVRPAVMVADTETETGSAALFVLARRGGAAEVRGSLLPFGPQ